MLNIHSVPAFNDNYIWLAQSPDSQHTIIIDPGDAIPVIQRLTEQDLKPVAILITHQCHDHVDGIQALVDRYQIPVYGPARENIPCLTHPLSATNSLLLHENFPHFKVLDTPGHTAGHIVFYIEDYLFCGDTLFGAGCGRLHNGTAEQLFDSLQQIAKLPITTKIYCAHEYTEANLHFAQTVEPNNADIQQRIEDTALTRQRDFPSIPSSLSLELATNPFLRCSHKDVIQAVQSFSEKTLPTTVEVFTELRKWKDQF